MRLGRVAAAAAALLVLAGCSEAEPAAVETYQPASVGDADENGVKPVTFTRVGVERIGLRTAVAEADGGATVVDYAALVYDGTGRPWVFTGTGPRTFVRAPVLVTRVDGDRALLAEGPSPGTRVAVVGVAELYGAELGIAGGH